jgi:hypothetical protein
MSIIRRRVLHTLPTMEGTYARRHKIFSSGCERVSHSPPTHWLSSPRCILPCDLRRPRPCDPSLHSIDVQRHNYSHSPMILHERGRLRVFRCLHTVYNLVEKTTRTITEPSKRFQHKGFKLAVLAYEGLRVLVYFVFLSVLAGSTRRYLGPWCDGMQLDEVPLQKHRCRVGPAR